MRRRINFTTFCILFMLLGVSVCFSQGAGQPGEFLRVGVGSRALGLGQAYSALAQGAEAMYWNPGGMARQYYTGINFSVAFSKPFDDTDFGYFAVAFPLQHFWGLNNVDAKGEHLNWTLATGYLYINSGGFTHRDELGNIKGTDTFSDNQSALFFSVSRKPLLFLGHSWGLGGTLKIITHSLFGESSTSFGGDFGLQIVDDSKEYRFGLTFQNFNEPNIGFASNAEDVIPRTIRAGFAFNGKLISSKPFLNALWIAIDTQIKNPENRKAPLFIGAELDIMKISRAWKINLPMKLRIGYSGSESRKSLNIGLSASIRIPKTYKRIELDYAFDGIGINSDLGRFSFPISSNYNWPRLTAKDWYEKGKIQKTFPIRGIRESGNVKSAEEAFDVAIEFASEFDEQENYKKASLLRKGDLSFIQYIFEREIKTNKESNLLVKALSNYNEAKKIVVNSDKEIDKALRDISDLYYFQSLIYSENDSNLVAVSESISGREGNIDTETQKMRLYLKAYTNYQLGTDSLAIDLINTELRGYPIAEYLLGLMYYELKEYQDAISQFNNVLNTFNKIPEHIFVPYFEDNNVSDDAQFMIGECYLQQNRTEQAIIEYAKVPRYYPDLSKVQDAREKIKANLPKLFTGKQ